MQRYNPVYDAVDRLIQSGTLGELLHGSFENYASDENLPPEHWFWDRSKSGGIFVEHGVHFFDLFAGWLGPGRSRRRSVDCVPALAADRGACPVHASATARRCSSISITDFIRPAGWTGRSCAWSSSAAT